MRKLIISLLLIPCLIQAKDYQTAAYDASFKFIENKSQWPEEVLYKTEIPAGQAYIISDGILYNFYDKSKLAKKSGHCHTCSNEDAEKARTSIAAPAQGFPMHAIRMRFLGSNENAAVIGNYSLTERHNYFLGNEPGKWASGCRAFNLVEYQQLYPGIDLHLYGNEGKLKYDLIVAPGVDPNQVKINYEGANGLILKNGKLSILSSVGEIYEQLPLAYQIINGDSVVVTCAFKLENNEISFQFKDSYDTEHPLIIDPELVFSSFSGSFADNWGNTATYDERGNLYSGGITQAPGFPVTIGAYQVTHGGSLWDVGILKFDSIGHNLLYATYLGGNSSETPHSLIVNSNDELLILGTTGSDDFPVQNAYQPVFAGGDSATFLSGVTYQQGSDNFLARLSSNGSSLLSSTYLGGSKNDGALPYGNALVKNYGDQYRGEVIVDSTDNVYIATVTSSMDFPLAIAAQSSYGGGSHDGIVARFSPDLSVLEWSTYFGGSGIDAAYSLKVRGDSLVYFTGGTTSSSLATAGNVYRSFYGGNIDGYIAAIDQKAMQIKYATYLGTNQYDQAYFIDIDDENYVYALGQTTGNFPVKAVSGKSLYANNNSGQFIIKLNFMLEDDDNCFSTIFGSGIPLPNISLTAFLVNECGNLYVSGFGLLPSQSGYITLGTNNMPITDDAFQATTDNGDFYFMVLLQDAQELLYATYFGGNESPGQEHVDGGTSRFDRRGIIYQAVCAGCNNLPTSEFPTTPGAYSRTKNNERCNNAVIKFDLASLLARFTTDSPEYDQPGLNSGCFPLEVVFINQSIGGKDFFWDFGNGVTSTEPDFVTVTFEEPGTYPVELVATDINTCVRQDTAYGTITVFDQQFVAAPDDTICFGDDIRLYAAGGVSYEWSPAESLDNPSLARPTASPDSTTTYYVHIQNENGCETMDTVNIAVIPELTVDFTIDKLFSCTDYPQFLLASTSKNVSSQQWTMEDGFTSEEEFLTYQFQDSGRFEIQLQGVEDICSQSKTIEVSSSIPQIPNVFTPNKDPKNEYFQISTDDPIQLEIYNRWGKVLRQWDNYQNDWNGDNLSSGVYYYIITFPDETTCNGWLHILR